MHHNLTFLELELGGATSELFRFVCQTKMISYSLYVCM